MTYEWDFSKIKRVSFRKGGRVFAIRKDGSEEQIAPEDQEEFREQYYNHLKENLKLDLADPRWAPVGDAKPRDGHG